MPGEILILTSRPQTRAQIMDALSNFNTHNVTAVEETQRALDLCEERDVHMALIDLTDGPHFLPAIRAIGDSGNEVIVLAIVPGNEIQAALDAVRAGASDFLSHPFDGGKIILRTTVALEQRRSRVADRLYRMILEERVNERTQEVYVKREKLRNQFLNTISALARALQAKHVYTEGHSRRVALASVRMAKALGLARDEVRDIELGALFHDIGKIGIREAILNKESALDDEEYDEMKMHPIIAEQILSPIEELRDMMDIIKHEHERWDGLGYPYGVKAEKIPLGARIVSIADAYDAMVTDRSYRKGGSPEKAFVELRRCAGAQFDPRLTDLFIQLTQEDIEAGEAAAAGNVGESRAAGGAL